MYQHVLVATGGSPWSEAAVTYAIAIAARTGASLQILTVLHDPAVASILQVVPGESVDELLEEQAQAMLAAAASQAQGVGVTVQTRCVRGSVPETILQTVADSPCDLIVLGARQVSDKRMRLGEIANIVTAKAPPPVLVVKTPPEVAPGSPLGRCILVPTGGSPQSDTAVDYAITLAQTERFSLCLLHVIARSPNPNDEFDDIEGRHILAQAETRAVSAGVSTTTVLSYGYVAQTILETAVQQNCDGIIMGARGMTGWKRAMIGSISNTVAVATPLPVLLVKHFWDF